MQRPRLGRRLGSDLVKAPDPLWAIVASLLVASVITVYPIPYHWVTWRPMMMLMVTLFWVLCQPKWCGIWFAFSVGLSCDLMLDTPLGQYALSFVVVCFSLRLLVQNKRVITFANLWILNGMGCFLYLLLFFILQKISGQMISISHWATWLPSMLVWPLIYYSLNRWRV